jgi:hypothetical protein
MSSWLTVNDCNGIRYNIAFMIDSTHLLHETGTVISKPIHYKSGGVSAYSTGRFRCYRQRVDQCLRVSSANISQEIIDRNSDCRQWSLDTSDQLKDCQLDKLIYDPTYLRNDIQPCINRHHSAALTHCQRDSLFCSKFEPQSQNPQRILQRIVASQCDRAEEAYREVRSG